MLDMLLSCSAPLYADSAVGRQADLLLLNASNYPKLPIYPYALVQLRALALRQGLSVAAIDLSEVSERDLGNIVGGVVARTRPRLVGLHLRQADSLLVEDYLHQATAYLPVQQSVALAKAVRSHTDAPIAIGGFGFTVHGTALFKELPVDIGVLGEPDDLFRRFDHVCAGRDLNRVPGLVYRDSGGIRTNPRTLQAPLDDREYDDGVVKALRSFYGLAAWQGSYPPSIAIEISRGCPFTCAFCTEPVVKGRRVRRRNLDAAFADVEFLLRQGFWHFWMVCSEINMGGSDLALAVADRFIRLREQIGGRQPMWRAYHLPRWLAPSDMATLVRSGFAGGWNDCVGFDDAVLKTARVPYRRRHLDAHFAALEAAPRASAFPGERAIGLFAGDLAATPRSILGSLTSMIQLGRRLQLDRITLAKATRTFHVLHGDRPELKTYSWGVVGDGTSRMVTPTFAISPAVGVLFDDLPAAVAFLSYLEEVAQQAMRPAPLDVAAFLATHRIRAILARLKLTVANEHPRRAFHELLRRCGRATRPRITLRRLLAPRNVFIESSSALALLGALSCRFGSHEMLLESALSDVSAERRDETLLWLECFLHLRRIDLDRSSTRFFRAACA